MSMRALVAIDLGPTTDAVLKAARAQRDAGATVAVCHVVPNVVSVRPLFPHLAAAELAQLSAMPARAEEAVRQRVQEAAKFAEGDYELFVDQGVDYAEIVRRAETWKADRILIGASGSSGVARLLGGVAERVVRYAPCSVLCVRDGAERTGAVIAATDLSDPSVPAIAEALAEARARGKKLVVVHAVDLGDLGFVSTAFAPFGANLLPPDAIEGNRQLARETIASHLERLGAKDSEIVIEDGSAASAILRLAESRGAGLVVVGTRGKTGLARLALGSVAERTVRGASTDVLVVRLATA